MDEFARTVREELDYRHEARNAEAFRRNFAGDDRGRGPAVYWRYTTARVLTLERIDGHPAPRPRPRRAGARGPAELAYRMTDTWMTMIFRHGFFHGDPHPANILVLDDGRSGLVDFGLAGS